MNENKLCIENEESVLYNKEDNFFNFEYLKFFKIIYEGVDRVV